MMWPVWFGLVLALLTIFFALLRHRHRARRAEVLIETLRIWREFLAEYRRQNPEETYSMSIPEEACYMAVNGPRQLRKTIARQAFLSVQNMNVYAYNEYDDGDYIGNGQILAHSASDAARKVTGCDVIALGFAHQLRVKIVSGARENESTDFYTHKISN